MVLRFEDVVREFQIEGAFVDAKPHGSGHINRTYCVWFDEGGVVQRYLLQRLNGEIFLEPELLMENVARVTAHLAKKVKGERRVLTLIAARDGQMWHRDAAGGFWRVVRFIDGARTYDAVETENQAFEGAKAFGNFQRMLADLPAPRLHETIPGFHDTAKRVRDFERAVELDVANRAAGVAAEIEFVLSRKAIASVLMDADLPERVTHNDTKLNNVMFDELTGEALCVVDLDTVMPGLALYDFGDMVRTATSPTEEDERDLSLVAMRFGLFEALVRGYLESAGGFLTEAEKSYLPFAGKLIAYEQGVRFLADHLNGDVYYNVTREGQNLDRCRTQLKMVESIEEQEEAMERLVASL